MQRGRPGNHLHRQEIRTVSETSHRRAGRRPPIHRYRKPPDAPSAGPVHSRTVAAPSLLESRTAPLCASFTLFRRARFGKYVVIRVGGFRSASVGIVIAQHSLNPKLLFLKFSDTPIGYAVVRGQATVG